MKANGNEGLAQRGRGVAVAESKGHVGGASLRSINAHGAEPRAMGLRLRATDQCRRGPSLQNQHGLELISEGAVLSDRRRHLSRGADRGGNKRRALFRFVGVSFSARVLIAFVAARNKMIRRRAKTTS